jgi:hypothetical protein
VAQPGNLRALIEVVENMQQRVALIDIHDRLARKYPLHGRSKDFPILRPVEIIHNQEAAA